MSEIQKKNHFHPFCDVTDPYLSPKRPKIHLKCNKTPKDNCFDLRTDTGMLLNDKNLILGTLDHSKMSSGDFLMIHHDLAVLSNF